MAGGVLNIEQHGGREASLRGVVFHLKHSSRKDGGRDGVSVVSERAATLA